LWALENGQAEGFLWEKYTTFPFTEQKKCKYIDEVVTPWPCFVIAVRNTVLEKHGDLLEKMCQIVQLKAKEMKNNEDSVEVISWRYNLRSGQVANWLIETDWNYDGIEYPLAFERTVRTLNRLGLITNAASDNWQQKLFYQRNVKTL
jgi:predicted transcriptional regulator